ncbi:hypothetical protein HC776_03090 [bacterium]|nr:hypothetical protein [bacterium]
MTKSLLWGLIVGRLWVVPLQAQHDDAGYQEALRRIEAARVSGAVELDLSGLGLTTLPPQIGQLTHSNRRRRLSS